MTELRRWTLFHERIELANGPSSIDIGLTINSDESVIVDGCYAGPEAKVFWGDWDHEFWLTIPPGHLHALLALALCDAFTRKDCLTYPTLLNLLRQAEIPFKESHWT